MRLEPPRASTHRPRLQGCFGLVALEATRFDRLRERDSRQKAAQVFAARANVISLKFVFISAAGLALAAGVLIGTEWGRIERAAEADIKAILDAEHVSITATMDGILGTALGQVESVTIEASGFEVEGMPLFTDPELSQRGKMRRLEIVLKDFVIRDLPVIELRCDIPDNRFALGLLREGKVRLTKSGEGVGSVVIDEQGLERYILARFRAAESIDIKLDKYKLFAKGTASLAMIRRNFEIICDLAIEDKRRLVIADPITFIEGKRIRDGSDSALLRAFNPVLDLDRDLGLHGAFDMETILIKGGIATIKGKARIPVRPANPPEQPTGK